MCTRPIPRARLLTVLVSVRLLKIDIPPKLALLFFSKLATQKLQSRGQYFVALNALGEVMGQTVLGNGSFHIHRQLTRSGLRQGWPLGFRTVSVVVLDSLPE